MKQILKLITVFFGAIIMVSCSPGQMNEGYVHSLTDKADTNVILPPAWAFGMLYGGYTNQESTIETIKEIQQHNYPIDAYWIDSWFWSFDDEGIGPHKYIDFIADTIAYPNRKAMWSFMEQNNIKGGFWVWDCIQQTGNEEAFADFKARGFFRDVYMNTNPWHNKSTSTAMHMEGAGSEGTPTGNIDFDNPEAAAYFKSRMKHFFDEGADFIKLDRTTRLSVVKTMFEMSQEFGKETKGRGFMLSHMDGIADEAYKCYPTKWTSDTRSDWTIEAPLKEFNSWVPHVAFKENIALYTHPDKKTSEIPFLTNDTGGFDMGNTDELDEELYIRWVQFSIFTAIASVFSQPENPTGNLAWRYSERADTLFRFYSHLRQQLFPYIYSYAHMHRISGEHMIRKIPGKNYEYLFGNEMLVAPVYQQGATTREVDFPEGNWIDYWTGTIHSGGSLQLVDAPIDRIPLFIREGSVIPMRNYFPSIEAGNNDVLRLDVYPGANSSFNLIEDDGVSNDYINGIFSLTRIDLSAAGNKITLDIHPAKGYYNGMNPLRDWSFNVYSSGNPEKVTINRKQVEYIYNEENNHLTFSASGLQKNIINSVVIEF